MKIKLVMLVSLLALGLATNANAGAVADADSDLVPDAFDNCLDIPNGPGEASNQVDTDIDGYGEACDPDYDQDIVVGLTDFSIFLGDFTTGTPANGTDHDGDGVTGLTDFSVFVAFFSSSPAVPGPSGLACAGTPGCIP
jgi:hypothetical protein